jgi:hypothetical protein
MPFYQHQPQNYENNIITLNNTIISVYAACVFQSLLRSNRKWAPAYLSRNKSFVYDLWLGTKEVFNQVFFVISSVTRPLIFTSYWKINASMWSLALSNMYLFCYFRNTRHIHDIGCIRKRYANKSAYTKILLFNVYLCSIHNILFMPVMVFLC